MKYLLLLLSSVLVFGCAEQQSKEQSSHLEATSKYETCLTLLGTMQDGGQPHIGCVKECCSSLFENPDRHKQVISLGLYDHENNKRYLFEATPDISRQMKSLKRIGVKSDQELADAIFLTHAHIGHYAGLMYLGKEAMGAKQMPVYAMPRMREFISNNGPWDQLITEKNISLMPLESDQSIRLFDNIVVTPFTVPHRDEYSETVGYKIIGPSKSAMFIPDIDKWEKWDRNIIEEIASVDYAFLDATFYSGAEIGNRDISLIPHPFIIESLEKFKNLPASEKQKIIFIHFNHTNPVANPNSLEAKKVLEAGFRIGTIYDVFEL